ncbi:invasion protein [Pseudomonas sp. Pseusp16]|uniref:SpaN/EivJ family type III secretion system needle length determinant n=1 Tax=Pseudomonas sp. Pseusp16 TaxID=3243021 RepID=UPI0039B5E681
MKDVSVISLLPVQALDPVTEGSMDELRDMLVSEQEEELPQGVLELMATLILRHRPVIETGRTGSRQSMAIAQATDLERDEVRSTARVATSYPQASPLYGKPINHLLPQSMAAAASPINRVTASPHLNPPTSSSVEPALIGRPSIAVEPVLIERPSSTVESLSVERAANSSAPSVPTFDGPLPEALSSHPTPRQVPWVARLSILPPATLQPLPALDVTLETLSGSDRSLLQVPFNKGTASGQVTISRVPDEPTRNLQLSPSNALVFEQIKVPFEQVREPAWRLTDSGGEQQRQGSHQAPDDEQAEDPGLPA